MWFIRIGFGTVILNKLVTIKCFAFLNIWWDWRRPHLQFCHEQQILKNCLQFQTNKNYFICRYTGPRKVKKFCSVLRKILAARPPQGHIPHHKARTIHEFNHAVNSKTMPSTPGRQRNLHCLHFTSIHY